MEETGRSQRLTDIYYVNKGVLRGGTTGARTKQLLRPEREGEANLKY